MAEPLSLLMFEFLDWLATRDRDYEEAAEAWRSTCPRHTEWEDAFIRGLVRVEGGNGSGPCTLTLTAQGRALLEGHRALQRGGC